MLPVLRGGAGRSGRPRFAPRAPPVPWGLGSGEGGRWCGRPYRLQTWTTTAHNTLASTTQIIWASTFRVWASIVGRALAVHLNARWRWAGRLCGSPPKCAKTWTATGKSWTPTNCEIWTARAACVVVHCGWWWSLIGRPSWTDLGAHCGREWQPKWASIVDGSGRWLWVLLVAHRGQKWTRNVGLSGRPSWTEVGAHRGREWQPKWPSIVDGSGCPLWAKLGAQNCATTYPQVAAHLKRKLDCHLSAMEAHAKWRWAMVDTCKIGRPHLRITRVHEARL